MMEHMLHPFQFAVAMECASFDPVPIQQELWEQIVLSKITLVTNSKKSFLPSQAKQKNVSEVHRIFPVIKENKVRSWIFGKGC